MGEVIINGKIYTIYEKLPENATPMLEVQNTVFKEQNKQKRADWKNARRYGYRKK